MGCVLSTIVGGEIGVKVGIGIIKEVIKFFSKMSVASADIDSLTAEYVVEKSGKEMACHTNS